MQGAFAFRAAYGFFYSIIYIFKKNIWSHIKFTWLRPTAGGAEKCSTYSKQQKNSVLLLRRFHY